MNKLWFLFLLVFVTCAARAEIYVEGSLEGGGKTVATVERSNDYFSVDEDLNLGGGIKLSVGVENTITEDGLGSLSLALGLLWDRLDADNGDADFSTITFEAIYNRYFDRHQIGVGASYHMDPHYDEDIDGFAELDVDFDDSLGVVFKYSYEIVTGLQLGARYTVMEYEVGNTSLDADSFGLFLSSRIE